MRKERLWLDIKSGIPRILAHGAFIFPSRFLSSLFEKSYGKPNLQKILPNPMCKFSVAPPQSRPKSFGYLGNVNPEKGVGVLVRAFQNLSDEDIRLHLHGVVAPQERRVRKWWKKMEKP